MTEQIKSMREYFLSGSTMDYAFRLLQLKTLKSGIKKYEDALIEALKADMGKSPFESYMLEIGSIYEEINFALKNLKKWMKPAWIASPVFYAPSSGKMYHEPLGLVLIMSPWNYPVQLTLAPLIASIAGGNCSVLKPSRFTPTVTGVLKNIVKEFFKPDYITLFEGGSEMNKALLAIKFDHIFFTGSPDVGKVVMEAASKFLTPVTLELGGKNPCIVDKSADIDMAAKRIVWGKTVNAGQTCVEPDYILVHSSVKDVFIDAAKKYIKQSYGENPIDSPDFPQIINEKHFNRLLGLMKDGNILHGGRNSLEKRRIEPTIIDSVTIESPIMQEEIFGPLMPVLTFNTIEDIYTVVRNYPKSLALYLFTKDNAFEREIMRNLSFGGGCVNEVMLHVGNSNGQFGGVGDSGMGAYHGKKGFSTLTHDKYVLKKPYFLDLFFRYPPYGNKVEILKKIQK